MNTIRAILTTRENPQSEPVVGFAWPADESPPEVICRDDTFYAIDPGFNAFALDDHPNAVRYFRCTVLSLP